MPHKVDYLTRNAVVVTLTVQQSHDNAKGSMQASQGVPQGHVGAHRGAVSKAIQMPATTLQSTCKRHRQKDMHSCMFVHCSICQHSSMLVVQSAEASFAEERAWKLGCNSRS